MLDFFDEPTRQLIVQATILLRLDYANSLLLGANKAEITCLLRVQKVAARVLLRLPGTSSASAALRHLHWLPIPQRIQFKALCLTFKILKTSSPEILSNLLAPYVPTRSLRSAEQLRYGTPCEACKSRGSVVSFPCCQAMELPPYSDPED